MHAAIRTAVRETQRDVARRFWNLPMKPKTAGQLALFDKHGSPHAFAMACCRAVGDMISVSEAEAGIAKYLEEWKAA